MATKAYQYRIYPSKKDVTYLNSFLRCEEQIWNWARYKQKQNYNFFKFMEFVSACLLARDSVDKVEIAAAKDKKSKTLEEYLKNNKKFKRVFRKTIRDTLREEYNIKGFIHNFDMSKIFTQESKTSPFLKDVKNFPSNAFRKLLEKFFLSYQAFFKKVATGQRASPPKFKGERNPINSIDCQSDSGMSFVCDEENNKCEIKILPTRRKNKIRVKMHRPLPEGAIIKRIMISRENHHFNNRWYANIVFDYEEKKPRKKNKKVIALDVGCRKFFVGYDGKTVNVQKNLVDKDFVNEYNEKRTSMISKRDLQKNEKKDVTKKTREINRLNIKMKNKKKDIMKKISKELSDDYGYVITEKLNIKGMVEKEKRDKDGEKKKRNIRKVTVKDIHQNSWYMFKNFLKNKTTVVDIDPRNTSKMCSNCGTINELLGSKEKYKCEQCGMTMDRDENAARNIYKKGELEIKAKGL